MIRFLPSKGLSTSISWNVMSKLRRIRIMWKMYVVGLCVSLIYSLKLLSRRLWGLRRHLKGCKTAVLTLVIINQWLKVEIIVNHHTLRIVVLKALGLRLEAPLPRWVISFRRIQNNLKKVIISLKIRNHMIKWILLRLLSKLEVNYMTNWTSIHEGVRTVSLVIANRGREEH